MRTFDTIRANTKLNPTTVRCPDVNSKNKFGGTPVLYAAEGGHREIVELLIADLLRTHRLKVPGGRIESGWQVAQRERERLQLSVNNQTKSRTAGTAVPPL